MFLGRKALLEWIDGCPIAIESVGTRIKNTGIGYEKLLTTLKEGTGIQGVLNSKLISIYRDALTQLLECEDQTRQKLYSQAGKLLLVFSYLDPRDLWHGILERAQIDPDAPEWFRSVANSEAEFERVIKVLLSHSLLRVDRKKAEVFTMHNVVREACHLFAETQGPNEYLAIAVGCVAYSDVSDFHLKEREIRARLSPHADAILKPLVSHYDQDKISIRGFLYSSASQKHQDLIYKIFDSDKDDKSDKYLGYFHPVMRLAFLFIWSNKYENASQVCSAAITNLSRSTLKDDYALASLKACHALLLYRQKRYDEAMPVAIETHDLTCRLFTLNSREGLWTWRIIAALKRKLPGGEMEAIEIGEKTIEMSAILCGKDSENYIWAVSDNAFTFLDLDLPQARDLYVEAFLKTRELLGSDHLETIYAAAHINLKSMEESTKFEQRIFFARKAWEGFSIALGEGADDTLNQAKQLAWFYGEEEDFEHCAEIRRIIVREMKRRSYESDEDRLDFCRNYKSLADSLIRIWEDNEFLEESLYSSQTNIPASDEAENIKKPDSSNNGDQPRVQTESHSEPTAGENVQIEGKRAKTNEQEVTEEQKDQAGTTTNDPGADSQSKSSTLETEILACLSEALAITKSLNKDPDKSVLVTQFGIALAYTRVLRHNHAVEIIQGVLESYRQMKESVPNEIRVILSTLAETYYDAGEEAKVNNTLFEILQMPDDSSTDEQRAKVAESNAQICVKCRKYGLALPLLQKSYDISRHTLHSGNVDSMQTGLDYADCLKECGDLAEAEKVNNEVQVALEQVRDSEDKDILRLRCYSKYCLAFIKDHLNDEKSAHELFVEARHMYQELAKVDQSAYQMISDLNSIIGQLYLDQGKHDEAMSDFQKVVDLRAKYPKQISRQRECCAFYFMGRVKYDESKLEDAISYCLKARRYFLRNPTDPYDGDYLRQSEWLLVLCYFRCQQLGRLVSLVCEITQAPHNSYSDQYIFLCIAGFLGCSGNLEVAIALSLAVLKDCKAIFGVKNWRSLSALRMLKAFQIMHDELETYGKSILQYSLVASLEKTWACGFLTPDEVDILWIESEPISKTSPDHLLCGEEWEIPLLCGDSAHLLPELPAAFQKVLQYNNPPEGKIWPRSWTFWVDALQNNEYQAIPLWIAGAPVIIPLETRYPLSPALVPPADPHPPIAIGDFLSSDVIKLIFDCYDFADGFNVLWNGQLQIFVDQKFDFISALTEKPRTFGGLQVDYVSPSLVPSKFNCFHIRLDSLLPFSSTLRLNDNLSAATRSTRNAAFKPQGKLGLVVQSKGSNEKFATICSHVISKALEKRISGQVNPRVLRKAPSIREFRDKITIYAGDRFDDNKEKRVSLPRIDVMLIMSADSVGWARSSHL
jgi:tetratricopeptide (TPR) repeat protein